MAPYLILLLISAIVPLAVYRPRSMLSDRTYQVLVKKRNKLTIQLFFIVFFVLLALRDFSVGTDLDEYQAIFNRCANLSFDGLKNLRWETGYTIYNKLISLLSEDYRFFLIVTALIVLIPIYKLYVKENRYNLLSILIFINMPCFLMIFSGLRQAIAVSMGILAYMAIKNKKYVLSALTILLACSFHISALALVLLYPIFFLKIKTKHLFVIVPFMLLIYAFKTQLLLLLFYLLPKKYFDAYGEIKETGAFAMMILFLIFFVFAFVILDDQVMTNDDYFMRNIIVVTTIFQFFVPVHGLIQRASYYFMIFVPVSIVRIVQAPKITLKSISNLAILVMGCFFALFFFYNAAFSTDNLLDVFPYKFFWSE